MRFGVKISTPKRKVARGKEIQLSTVIPSRVNGRLDLHFKYSAQTQQTQLQIITQTPPMRVIRAFQLADGAALAHVHNVSGGVLGGDKLELTVTVEAEAKGQLTTPSATRVYRHREGMAVACQYTVIDIGANGLLEYLPDPLIPFAQARYQQTTHIQLAEGAGLFWWEMVAPGREAKQEFFAYDWLETRVDIWAKQRPIALERQRLCPHEQSPTSLIRLGRYGYYTTFYICRVGETAATWTALEQELAQLAQEQNYPGQTMWGVSSLVADGLVVRGLGQAGRDLMSGLVAFWRLAKRRLYGAEVELPRKMY